MKPTVPWSVKGVEPDAREAAKRAARSAGMTLGAWLNQKLLESEGAGGIPGPSPSYRPSPYRAPDPYYDPEPPVRARETYARHQDTGELEAVSETLNALRRHLEDADNRAERTFGQLSRSLETMLDKLDEAGQRRRATPEWDGTSTSLRAISTALGDVSERLTKVETRPQADDSYRGIERSLAEINRNFDSAIHQTGRRIDKLDDALDKVADKVESRDGRRMEAVRGLERVVSELASQHGDLQRQQSTSQRDLERRIDDTRTDTAERDAGLVRSIEALRERIFELSSDMETVRRGADEALKKADLNRFEKRIAEALENTAKAEELAALQSQMTSRTEAAIEQATEQSGRALREDMIDRIDAAEARSADAIARLRDDLPGENAGAMDATALDDLKSHMSAQMAELASRFDTIKDELDERLNRAARDTHTEIEALRHEFLETPRQTPEPTRPELRKQQPPVEPTQEIQREIPEPTPAREQDLPHLQPRADGSGRVRRDPQRARVRPEPVPKTPPNRATHKVERPGLSERKQGGVRLWVVLLFLVLIGVGFGGLGYTAVWVWEQIGSPDGPAPASSTQAPTTAYPGNAPQAENRPPAEQQQPARNTPEDTPAEDQPQIATSTSTPTVTPAQPDPEPAVQTPPPAPTAVELYTEAVGLLESQNNRSDGLAANRLIEASEMGLTIAQYRLATLYEEGRGVDQSFADAATWYTQAAAGGNARAMHNLAIIHAEGHLGETDFNEAARWFAEAASYGVRDSQFNLAVMFENGWGVRDDDRQAYLWYAIAETGGDTDAGAQRDRLAETIPADVRQRIDTAVAGWEPRPVNAAANGRLSLGGPLGPSRQDIARTQQLLGGLGFDAGEPDGLMGPRTTEAIRTFERRAGLPVTGRVTPELLSRLETEYAASRPGG